MGKQYVLSRLRYLPRLLNIFPVSTSQLLQPYKPPNQALGANVKPLVKALASLLNS